MDKSDGCAPQPEPYGRRSTRHYVVSNLTLLALCLFASNNADAQTLAKIRENGVLRYGSDAEGGGPFIFLDPSNTTEMTGFETELIRKLCGGLGPKPVYTYGRWDTLLQVLDTEEVDIVLNGYELTESRARSYEATRPYYIYQLELMVPTASPLKGWDDLKVARPDGRKWKLGVLGTSSGDTFAKEEAGPNVEIVSYEGATDAMRAAANEQIDATLQDLPASRFYLNQYPELRIAGEPVGRGYYVIYCRKADTDLVKALNEAIGDLIVSGELRKIYEKYDIWTDLQYELANDNLTAAPSVGNEKGLALIWQYRLPLLDAAWVTFWLSVTSMPIAIAIGLVIALLRLYGPSWVQSPLHMYIEVLRGTPLMMQLYVLYFVLRLPREVAAVAGLAINYSAYESEIWRAGLQAIPKGQMEAALALGMKKLVALRRIIVPQATRIVIPAVTNDFIALFKDTSVCSVITMVELTKSYSINSNSTGGIVEFALATSCIYMLMSIPLSILSRWTERKLGRTLDLSRGGVI